MGSGVAFDEGMVPGVRLGTLTMYLITSYRIEEYHGLWVCELHLGKLCDMLKVRYYLFVFEYILWKVKSTMGYGLVSYI